MRPKLVEVETPPHPRAVKADKTLPQLPACAECRVQLTCDDETTHDGEMWMHVKCAVRRLLPKCCAKGCGAPIEGDAFPNPFAPEQLHHAECFKCTGCRKSMALDHEVVQARMHGGSGKGLFHAACAHKHRLAACARCRKRIETHEEPHAAKKVSEYDCVHGVDGYYHQDCFKCANCHNGISGLHAADCGKIVHPQCGKPVCVCCNGHIVGVRALPSMCRLPPAA